MSFWKTLNLHINEWRKNVYSSVIIGVFHGIVNTQIQAYHISSYPEEVLHAGLSK